MIHIDDLERCVVIVIQHARAHGVSEVENTERGGYWTVPTSSWNELHEEPQLGVGSFDDDATELKKTLADPSRVSAVDLERVAHLLLRLSDQLVESPKAVP